MKYQRDSAEHNTKSNQLHCTRSKRSEIYRLLLKKLFCNSAVKIAHNAKFEWQFLTQAGLQPSGYFFDTQLAYQVVNAGIKTSASLENVARKLLRIQLDKTLQTSNWHQQLTPQQLQYAANAFVATMKPVIITMSLSSLAVIYIQSPHDDKGGLSLYDISDDDAGNGDGNDDGECVGGDGDGDW
jgi:DNA polymerase I-like protein with 3'-5' exonuclease and polymerase domains